MKPLKAGTVSRIAVFGSWRMPADQRANEQAQGATQKFSHELSQAEFQRACRELGHALARQNHQIFVASDSPSTIDYHIVQGALEALKEAALERPPILVVRSQARRSSKDDRDCSAIFAPELVAYPGMFELLPPLAARDWKDVHDDIAARADKVMVLGGGASAYRIAVKALGEGRPIVPVGVFGGAGRGVLQMLEKIADQRNFPKYEYRRVLAGGQWGLEQLNTSLYSLGVKQDPKDRHKIFIYQLPSQRLKYQLWLDLCGALPFVFHGGYLP